jgi:hypothetical protein
MTPAQAESMVRWYLNEADADACGLKAAVWSHTEEVTAMTNVTASDRIDSDESTPDKVGGRRPSKRGTAETMHVGAQSRSYHSVDVFPDSRSWARNQLRHAHQAWCALPPWAQATLEARFAHDGGRRHTVRGCSPVGRVVELDRGVRERARRDMVTARQAAEAQFSEEGDSARDAAILKAEEAVTRSVGLFMVAWAALRAERMVRFRARVMGAAS